MALPIFPNPDSKQLLELYKEKYPRHPSSTIPKTFINSARRELDHYYSCYNSETGLPESKLLYEIISVNYLNHIIRYQELIDEKAIAVYSDHQKKKTEELYAEFCKPSSLSIRINEALKSWIPPTTTTPGMSRQQMLMSKATSLQFILKSEYANLYCGPAISEDKWSPISLSLGFHHFQRTVNSWLWKPSINHKFDGRLVNDQNRHIGTFKKKYIQYMQVMASTNYEFLLSVISAFGVDVKEYPSKVLDLLNGRNMLRDFDEVETIQSTFNKTSHVGKQLMRQLVHNPWIPSYKRENLPYQEPPKTLMRRMLNKVTITNCDRMIEEFNEVLDEICDDEADMTELVNFMLEIFLTSPYFQYPMDYLACRIITTCGTFSKLFRDIFAETISAEFQNQLQSVSKYRERYLAVARICGNIYAYGPFISTGTLLETGRVIKSLLTKVWTRNINEDAEVLCHYLTIVGKKHRDSVLFYGSSNSKLHEKVNRIFEQLKQLSLLPSFSRRIQFALADIHELHQLNWNPKSVRQLIGYELNAEEINDRVRVPISQTSDQFKKQPSKESKVVIPTTSDSDQNWRIREPSLSLKTNEQTGVTLKQGKAIMDENVVEFARSVVNGENKQREEECNQITTEPLKIQHVDNLFRVLQVNNSVPGPITSSTSSADSNWRLQAGEQLRSIFHQIQNEQCISVSTSLPKQSENVANRSETGENSRTGKIDYNACEASAKTETVSCEFNLLACSGDKESKPTKWIDFLPESLLDEGSRLDVNDSKRLTDATACDNLMSFSPSPEEDEKWNLANAGGQEMVNKYLVKKITEIAETGNTNHALKCFKRAAEVWHFSHDDMIFMFKDLIMEKLPTQYVTIKNVVRKYGQFLTEYFADDEDFNWLVKLTEEIREEYVPIWVEFLDSVVSFTVKNENGAQILKEKINRTENGVELFSSFLK